MATYVPTQWYNNELPAINATNLNHIEEGIVGAYDEIDKLISGETPVSIAPASATVLGGVKLWVDSTNPSNIIGYIDSRV